MGFMGPRRSFGGQTGRHGQARIVRAVAEADLVVQAAAGVVQLPEAGQEPGVGVAGRDLGHVAPALDEEGGRLGT